VVPEAPLEQVEGGLKPAGEGWFVVNTREAQWYETADLGFYVPYESGDARFEQLGFNLGILRPGEPGGLYHGEDAQEDFLVLSGECLLVIEGEERRLKAWDFVHCPPWTEHIMIGAGDGPCLIAAVGARREGRGITYPVNEVALKHGAGVEKETTDAREAYAGYSQPEPVPCPSEFPEALG
jgi:uncharacterized cupin superfamily protein